MTDARIDLEINRAPHIDADVGGETLQIRITSADHVPCALWSDPRGLRVFNRNGVTRGLRDAGSTAVHQASENDDRRDCNAACDGRTAHEANGIGKFHNCLRI